VSFQRIELNFGPRLRPICRTDESLSHFRTIAFGIESMREWIQIDRIDAAIELGTWLHLVPECYRPSALDAARRVLESHRGRKLTERALYEFVDDLNREIFATVEPIEP
jgi:hypothetical protein